MLRLGLLLLLGLMLLSACAPTAAGPGKTPPMNAQLLRDELAELSGVILTEEPLLVRFPVGTLFAEEALLPMPGGVEVLDPLAAILRKSNQSWLIKVRAATGEGAEYDARLASERAGILKTYLVAAGVDPESLEFTSLAEAGDPLEMRLK